MMNDGLFVIHNVVVFCFLFSFSLSLSANKILIFDEENIKPIFTNFCWKKKFMRVSFTADTIIAIIHLKKKYWFSIFMNINVVFVWFFLLMLLLVFYLCLGRKCIELNFTWTSNISTCCIYTLFTYLFSLDKIDEFIQIKCTLMSFSTD